MRALHPNPACIQPQHALPLFALVCPGFSLFFFCFFSLFLALFFWSSRVVFQPVRPSQDPLHSPRLGAPSYPEETLWRAGRGGQWERQRLPPCSRWARKIRFHRAGPAAAIEGCCQFHNLPRPDGSTHTPPSLLLTGGILLVLSARLPTGTIAAIYHYYTVCWRV